MARLRLAALFLCGLVFLPTLSAEEPESVEALEKKLAELQAKLAAAKKAGGKKALTFSDADKWRALRGSSLSNDGKWFAHRINPNEGDGEVVLRNIQDGKETKFPGGGGFGSLAFSFDSKWFLFSVTPYVKPSPSSVGGPSPGGPPSSSSLFGTPRPKPKMVLVNLTTNDKTEFEGMSSGQFSGEAASHVAFRKAGEGSGPSLPPGLNLPPGVTLPPGLGGSSASAGGPSGADLVLRELATGTDLVLGNVSEFSFDKKGTWLVMVIDAAGQIGNGIQLRDMKTGSVTPIETAKASYRGLSWHEDFTAFTVIKGVEDKAYADKWNTILGFTDLGPKPTKYTFDPKDDKSFPADMGISANRPATWTKTLDAFSFGIGEQKKKDESKKDSAPPPGVSSRPTGGTSSMSSLLSRLGGSESTAKPDLVVWHWKDERLQPMQQLQATSDKNFTFAAIYHVKDKKFVRLADDTCRNVTLAPRHKYAIGIDLKPYEYMANLDGRRFSDVYTLDVKTGAKKLALKKVRYYFGPSGTGEHILYADDGHFFVYDVATAGITNITAGVMGTSFVDTEDDHNTIKPPTQPLGWSKDGKYVLLSDNWDIWQVAVNGSGGVNLTVNGKKDGIRYDGFSQYEPDRKEPGFDLSKPGYVNAYGEWTKKDGLGVVDPAKPGYAVKLWADCSYGLVQKARDADVFAVTKQTQADYPDVYLTDGKFADLKKVTDTNPQQKDYLWCAGSKLIDYTAVGQRLQGTLYLPANYEPGKKYPTIVYIYEKLSDGTHRYQPPIASGSGFSKTIYTSNGYAVLTPDITYKLNDPGKSSVECILAALDAAVASGVVDPDKVGLQGHSWGGYQTAFAVTQTNRFKAACAGAPLTDLVSMYSSVYWNTGSANQPIFESSQGRFTAGYWDQQEAYIRNSPVYFAKNVATPLLMLHNDKDGAVDFTQGVEYYNTLRRLQKPVVMLQYKGENHGLVKKENRLDYCGRMMEFFDAHLKGISPPDWWKDGVPHLKLDEHLKGRKSP